MPPEAVPKRSVRRGAQRVGEQVGKLGLLLEDEEAEVVERRGRRRRSGSGVWAKPAGEHIQRGAPWDARASLARRAARREGDAGERERQGSRCR